MNIKELQEEIRKGDKERGWDVSSLSQIFIHLVEEIGEIGRHVRKNTSQEKLSGTREINDEEFGEELADAIIFLVKIANNRGIDLNETIPKKINKNWERFPAEECLRNSKSNKIN